MPRADRARLTPLMGSIHAEGEAERDAAGFVAWLDSHKQVDRAKKIGTQGYCMGGALVMRTAAAQASRERVLLLYIKCSPWHP